MYLGLVLAVFLFIVAFSFITPWDGGDEGWVPWGVTLTGIASVLGVERARGRHLSTDNDRALATSYRARMFIGIGLAESAALFGIVGMFLSGSLWVYLVGAAFGLYGFWRVAPSKRNLAEDQAALGQQASSLNIMAALNNLPPPQPRPRDGSE
jgi:F0F1-type ATP synthase membrane subunit c/vacuolar-type H+-ATPase subunit K